MFLKSFLWILPCVAMLWFYAWLSPWTYDACGHAVIGFIGGWAITLMVLSDGDNHER